MIVGEDDAGAAVRGGIGDDRADREFGAALIALMARQVEAARLVIDMGDPQAFARGIAVGDAAGEERLGSGKPIEFQREFGTLIPHRAIYAAHAQAHRNRSVTASPLSDDTCRLERGAG